jgi:acyl-CoA reductase-like NAD-dependent aldehyde dehydrogenase
MNIAVINPATEELIREIPADTAQSVESKYQLLRTGQPAWAARSLSERLAVINRFYDLLGSEIETLALSLTQEMGKPLQQARNEINGARTRIKFFLDHSEKWLSPEWITPEGGTREKITYEALGVIANISAWNYPYLVGVNVFIPALIGGNAVFYKPSEYTLLTGLHIQRLFYQAGLPENVFQVGLGHSAVGELLLDLPLDGYYFTGSYKTGRYIATRVAPKLVPCQLELGGKDPLYVMDDVADINQVAGAALEGVVYNNGQSCCAVERIYVHEKVYDRFVTAFVDQARQLKIGNPQEAGIDIGPLSRAAQRDFLLGQIADAVGKGAKLESGGQALEGKGYFLEPAVLTDVDHSMAIMREESFGPVIGIMKVQSDEEAAKLMLDTEYGLTAAVYSTDFSRAESLMQAMDSGTVYWNCCDRVSAGLPWSGRKHSGLGSTLSFSGIRAFVQPKAWHIRG